MARLRTVTTGDRAKWEHALRSLGDRMYRLQRLPGIGHRSIGVPEWDGQLWRIGREWLAEHGDDAEPAPDTKAQGGDVYVATALYRDGGHTALIGDFVRALAAPAQIIVTNVASEHTVPIPDAIAHRTGVPAERIAVLPGPSLVDRLEQLFAALARAQPRRLFLFHHSFDPLASVVAQPEVAPLSVVVHHSDMMPSFTLHLPGVRIIDVTPQAAATTRLFGRVPALLHLTAVDPGPRPPGVLRRGRLVTASSGHHHKFAQPYAFEYAETVGMILRATGGWHVHIGSLDEGALGRIRRALTRADVAADRFVHVPWTDSIARTLWEHDCDVYCASFPIGGPRTRIDVMAAAIPHVRHSTSLDGDPACASDPGDRLIWRTWDDLRSVLRSLSAPAMLEEESARHRAAYDAAHHPRVFARELAAILAGGSGVEDPQARERLDRATQQTVRALTSALIRESEFLPRRIGRALWRRLTRVTS